MAYCRLCNQSSKDENKEIQAHSLGDTFVLCTKCPSAGMKSTLNEIKTTDVAASQALAKALQIREDISKLNTSKKFRIMVWGASPQSTSPIAQKRIELRRVLESLGHDVFFSEELVQGNTPINVQEAIQTDLVDLVICIASDFGPAGEAHELVPGMGKRALVWFDRRGQTAYAGTGLAKTLLADGTKVEYYDDDFVRCCAVVKGSLHYVDSMIALDNLADYYASKAERMKVRRS